MSHLIINARVLISRLPAEQAGEQAYKLQTVSWHLEGSGASLTGSSPTATDQLRWHLGVLEAPAEPGSPLVLISSINDITESN